MEILCLFYFFFIFFVKSSPIPFHQHYVAPRRYQRVPKLMYPPSNQGSFSKFSNMPFGLLLFFFHFLFLLHTNKNPSRFSPPLPGTNGRFSTPHPNFIHTLSFLLSFFLQSIQSIFSRHDLLPRPPPHPRRGPAWARGRGGGGRVVFTRVSPVDPHRKPSLAHY